MKESVAAQTSLVGLRTACLLLFVLSAAVICFPSQAWSADELRLQDLLDEALKNSPEILASQYRAKAAGHRVPQAGSLPDPMVMFGYQNEGWDKYTYGKMEGSQWMFSASQMFPFPGKLSLKEEMAARDAEGISLMSRAVTFRTIRKVSELYLDLFLAYRNIDLIRDREGLYSQIEDAALARYSSGMGIQQEVLMAQTEKYMLLEKTEMQRQRIQSLEAMLNTSVGRDVKSPLGRPAELPRAASGAGLEEMLAMAYEHSPELRSRQRMVAAAEAKVRMAEKEFYPDFTLNAGYFNRGGGQFPDMWNLTTTINVPIYYRTKQKEALLEAQAMHAEAGREYEATKLMIAAGVRDLHSMYRTAETLTELYRDGLIPRTMQDFESGIAGYRAGRTEAITVINRLKALIEYETAYWTQLVEKHKAVVRLNEMTGTEAMGGKDK